MDESTRKKFQENLALHPECTVKVWSEGGRLSFEWADGSTIWMEVDEARNFASQILSVAAEAEAEARAKGGTELVEDVGSDVIVVGSFRDETAGETILSHVRIDQGRVWYASGNRTVSQSIPEFMSLASGIYAELADILDEGKGPRSRTRPPRKSRIIR